MTVADAVWTTSMAWMMGILLVALILDLIKGDKEFESTEDNIRNDIAEQLVEELSILIEDELKLGQEVSTAIVGRAEDIARGER